MCHKSVDNLMARLAVDIRVYLWPWLPGEAGEEAHLVATGLC